MAESYSVIRRTDDYTLVECDGHYEVHRQQGERIVMEPTGLPGRPGDPGPPGPPGPAPTEEAVNAAIDAYELAHPRYFEWSSNGAVDIIDFDHPLGFIPNVQVVDSAGTPLWIPLIITASHVHGDLDGITSVTVTLS